MTDEPMEPEAPAKLTTREELDEELDRRLLAILKEGTVYVTKEGVAIPVPAPHQYLEIARKRVLDVFGKQSKEANPESDAAKLLEELNLPNSGNVHDMKMPPVSDDPDAATA